MVFGIVGAALDIVVESQRREREPSWADLGNLPLMKQWGVSSDFSPPNHG